MSAYEALMNKDLGAMEKPEETIPTGEWVLRCTAAKETENDEHDPNDPKNDHLSIVTFTHTPVEPTANFDEERVAEGTWRGVPLFTRRYIKTDRDLYGVREIIEAHGLSLEGRTLTDVVTLIRGKSVGVTVGLRSFPRRDGSTGKANTLSNFHLVG